MKKYILCILCLLVQSTASAQSVTLDFSSGSFNSARSIYQEDGFIVKASHGFHRIPTGNLAWYEAGSFITIAAGNSGHFNLNSLTIVSPPFSGLTFESSKGGLLRIGSITGPLSFDGPAWNDITSVKISQTYSNNILNQIDNIVLTPVPEPASLLLMISGLAVIGFSGLRRRFS